MTKKKKDKTEQAFANLYSSFQLSTIAFHCKPNQNANWKISDDQFKK